MKTLNPFVLENTDVYSLKSDITNKQYGICIQYPEGYLQRKDPKPLPVIYILDAQWHFPTICAIYGTLHHDRQMPESLIVGITWQEGNIFELRENDLTADEDPDAKHSGGADNFIKCLDQEIIPHINDTYNVSDKRVLIGSSYGGVFSYYAAIKQPELFTDYIAFGIGVNWLTPNSKFRQALKELKTKSISKPVRLIAGRGEWEPAYEVDEFSKELSELNIHNLQSEFITVKQAGHALVNPEGFTQSLQKIFHEPQAQVSIETLKQYCGTYTSKANEGERRSDTLEFYIEDGQLCTKIGFIANWEKFGRKAVLTPLSDSYFHILGWQKTFEFKEDQVILTLYGQPIVLHKLK